MAFQQDHNQPAQWTTSSSSRSPAATAATTSAPPPPPSSSFSAPPNFQQAGPSTSTSTFATPSISVPLRRSSAPTHSATASPRLRNHLFSGSASLRGGSSFAYPPALTTSPAPQASSSIREKASPTLSPFSDLSIPSPVLPASASASTSAKQTGLGIGSAKDGNRGDNTPMMAAIGARGPYDDGMGGMHMFPLGGGGGMMSEGDNEGGEPNAKRQRRGSGGASNDKRKEQNRAAQRAFRDRKEKYVRALEDKVQAQSEELASMRELLQRLQNENIQIRRDAGMAPPSPTNFRLSFASNVPDPRNRVAPVTAAATTASTAQSKPAPYVPPYSSPPASATRPTFATAPVNRTTHLPFGFDPWHQPGSDLSQQQRPTVTAFSDVGSRRSSHDEMAQPTQTPSPPPDSIPDPTYSASYPSSVANYNPHGPQSVGGASTTGSPPNAYDLVHQSRPGTASTSYDPRSAGPMNPRFDFGGDENFLPPVFADVFNRSFPADLFAVMTGTDNEASAPATAGGSDYGPASSNTLSPNLGMFTYGVNSSDTTFAPSTGAAYTPGIHFHLAPGRNDKEGAANYIPPPMTRLPCDKPECDFSAVSCNLPAPWAPPTVSEGTRNDELVSCRQAWAKLVSHPRFSDCDVDTVCRDLRDMAVCAVQEGESAPTLVVPKDKLVSMFKALGDRADEERAKRERTGSFNGEPPSEGKNGQSQFVSGYTTASSRSTTAMVGTEGTWSQDSLGGLDPSLG